MQTCNPLQLIQTLHAIYLCVTEPRRCPGGLTWWITLNDRMVVHLESGIATTACEADNMVLAVIYCDGGLIDGDVIRPHIEDDPNFTLILQVRNDTYVLHLCYIAESLYI